MESNKEERWSIDQAKQGQDLEELNKEKHADAPVGQLRPEQMDQFHAVTIEMLEILDNKRPNGDIDQTLDPTIRNALEALFEARTSTDMDTSEFISGLIRNKQLNQALMHLQPILALALRPDFREGRAIYDRLVGRVNEVRKDIKSAIMVQMQVATPEEAAKVEDKGEDEPGDADDKPDDQDAAGEGEEGEEGEEEEKSSTWLGRLLGRKGASKPTGNKKDEDDEDPEEPGS